MNGQECVENLRIKNDFPSNLWKNQYQLANEVLHPSSQGTFNRLGTVDSKEVITIGRTDYGLATPGEHSAISLAQLTSVFFNSVFIWRFSIICHYDK